MASGPRAVNDVYGLATVAQGEDSRGHGQNADRWSLTHTGRLDGKPRGTVGMTPSSLAAVLLEASDIRASLAFVSVTRTGDLLAISFSAFV
jgi:hypothetical protein